MSKNPPENIIKEIIILFNEGKILNVIEKSEILVSKYPKSIFLLNLLGVCYGRNNQLKKAKKYFEHSININPNFIDAHYNLGKTLKKLKDFSGSIISYKKAIELKPNYAEAYNNLGNIYKEINQLSLANFNYTKAIEIKPFLFEAYYNLGNIKKDLGKITESIHYYKKAINLNPNYAEAYNELGGAQIDIGKLKNGILSYKKAIELKPDYAKCYYNYTNSTKVLMDDPILLKLNKFVKKKNLLTNKKIHFAFAFGKAQLDIGEFENGLKYINIGNSLKNKELN